jgi:hypothetical protein
MLRQELVSKAIVSNAIFTCREMMRPIHARICNIGRYAFRDLLFAKIYPFETGLSNIADVLPNGVFYRQ